MAHHTSEILEKQATKRLHRFCNSAHTSEQFAECAAWPAARPAKAPLPGLQHRNLSSARHVESGCHD